MKKILIFLLALIGATAIFFIVLGYKSHSGSALGLANNQLQICPSTPNCVTSDHKTDTAHYVEPLNIQGSTIERAITHIRASIVEAGGDIKSSQENYIAATFSSSIFQFVDDFEIRVDSTQQKLHFRSASRVGKSDLGENLKRVNKVKVIYNKKQSFGH